MMQKINISIVTPCYNGWRYMGNYLKALEEQTSAPYEVIIIDDYSDDDSFVMLKKYVDASKLNIKLLRNNSNSGPSVSRENGIKKATGNYIAFCDCDDWYESEFIELVTDKIIADNADIVVIDNFLTFDNRRVVNNVVAPLVGKYKHEIIAEYKMSLCRLVVKRELFADVVYPLTFNGEDAAVVPQLMAKANKISFVDKPLYNYYFREGSLSTKISDRVYSGMIESFSAVETIRKEYPVECEFLGIKMICYAATLNAFKANINTKIIRKFMFEFYAKYPKWNKNPYLKTYSRFKRLYLKILSAKLYFVCRIMAKFHSKIVRNKSLIQMENKVK